MTKPLAYGTLLLLTSQLVAPAALAQVAGGQATSTPPATQSVSPTAGNEQTADEQAQESVEVSAPGVNVEAGDDIVVIGRNIPNVVRATPQVVAVLSSEDIARTGEGDIAGALTRVTGLSVVGAGFVYVRGLGDRYSSSLLNGSPLPSPEPLRRSVPLDVFPTTIVGSALVQKSYSANYPGEFGGGVINLTTRAIPTESFFQFGSSIAFDTETTSEFGYVYDGGGKDWLGYDDGTRKVPTFIREAGSTGANLTTDQVAQLNNAQTSVLQSNFHIPANWSGELSGAHVIDLGGTRLGIIGSASLANSFRTRAALQEDTNDPSGNPRSRYNTVITDNRIVANALLGLGAEFGEHRVRLTNVYIHDTLKQARGASSTLYPNYSGREIFDQDTNWFERQLFDTQITGEFKFDDLKVELRGSYANSKRKSPYERSFTYAFNPNVGVDLNGNPAGAWQNGLTTAGQENAAITFSDLNEDLWAGQADLAYTINWERPMTISAGYAYSDTQRSSSRYSFFYRADTGGSLGEPYRYLNAGSIFGPDTLYPSAAAIAAGVTSWCDTPTDGCIVLQNQSGFQGAAAYDASLRIHAGYIQAEGEILDGLRANVGVRYEDAEEFVGTSSLTFPGTTLANAYWLPASTITWNFAEDMQLRIHASKTIARPQFRELAPQFYQDFESDRQFFGNPNLKDSQLMNLEARYEWFFARDQRFSVAGFYKDIKNPIETVSFFTGESRVNTGFSYLPSANLYGVEFETQKYFPLDGLGGDFFATRRAVLIANYTYTQSSIKADTTCVPDVGGGTGGGCAAGFQQAGNIFRDGAPLTGQSDHLVNLQIGLEDTERLSQITVLFNYASERVTSRGATPPSGTGFLPDVTEKPGIRLDFVARQGVTVSGAELELKFEARNLTKTRYQEYQDFGGGQKVFLNRYDLGRVFSLGISAKL